MAVEIFLNTINHLSVLFVRHFFFFWFSASLSLSKEKYDFVIWLTSIESSIMARAERDSGKKKCDIVHSYSPPWEAAGG